MTVERIFIVGGTGNIGKAVVDELISKGAKLTLYSRDPKKVKSLFSTGDISIVEGTLQDLEPIKEGIKGCTRLFFLVADFTVSMEHVKKTIATYAYKAGVKQIVDLSSLSAGNAARTSPIGEMHLNSERAVSSIPNRGAYVTLRPGRFMSNILTFDRVHPDNVVRDITNPEEPNNWISPNDIAAVAAAALTEDVAKHGDSVYELIGDSLTPTKRAEVLSRVTGKDITYQQITSLDRYTQLTKFHMPHSLAYNLSVNSILLAREDAVSTGFPILIGREAETFEEYAAKNKEKL